MRSKYLFLFFFLLLTVATVSVACGGSSEPASKDDSQTGSSGSEASTGTATSSRPTSTPTPTPEPVLKHPGMALDLEQGDFWDFRWEYADQSCAQGSGCRTNNEDGVFRVTLGVPKTIDRVEVYFIELSGRHLADEGAVNLAPSWKYIGSDGTRLLASDGTSLVTIFDALDGEWIGGGFFSRFGKRETHVARPGSVSTQPFASWEGVRAGPAISVVRSDSESLCEVIEGRRICPRDQAFSVTENQYFREGIGPLGYNYRFSASFSGGGFFSSNSSEETVAVISTSLRGDVIEPTPTALPPTATPTVQPAIELDALFGPQDGSLTLTSFNNEIPDFATGVDLAVGVVDVTFVNPDVGGGDWSYGITFRHSEEETFHAVYVTSNGQWQHFSRGGTAESQISTNLGSVSLNTGAGAENTLFVAFNFDEAGFFVNGELVAELDLSTTNARVSGDVRVIAGVLSTDIYNGAESEFFDLTVLAP